MTHTWKTAKFEFRVKIVFYSRHGITGVIVHRGIELASSALGMKVNPKAGSSSTGKPIAKRLGPSKPHSLRSSNPIPSAALLSQPKPVASALQYKPTDEEVDVLHSKKVTNPTGTGESNVTANNEKTKSPPPQEEAKPPDDEDDKKFVLDEDEILSKEIGNIEKFRQNQKKIEDMNKRKKLALYDAIQQRQKQAKMEEKKLVAIHRELKALDAMVTHDISVVRDKIEDSSREYYEAQKKYDHIEKEFIEAKLDLHRKEEIKESLTDHLYTIIHQNEVRKAKKLAELMHKLNMEESGEEEALVGEVEHMELPCVTLFQPRAKPREQLAKEEGEKKGEIIKENGEKKTEEKDQKGEKKTEENDKKEGEKTEENDKKEEEKTEEKENKVKTEFGSQPVLKKDGDTSAPTFEGIPTRYWHVSYTWFLGEFNLFFSVMFYNCELQNYANDMQMSYHAALEYFSLEITCSRFLGTDSGSKSEPSLYEQSDVYTVVPIYSDIVEDSWANTCTPDNAIAAFDSPTYSMIADDNVYQNEELMPIKKPNPGYEYSEIRLLPHKNAHPYPGGRIHIALYTYFAMVVAEIFKKENELMAMLWLAQPPFCHNMNIYKVY
ncbi:hypothetical protein CAPTEDRAFT_199478 [Capitella teleta]|uniref:RAB6-interacting golgin n=1 Tax=Capitella teleta TaxID=283909 RepID=R7VDZ3_CAPTE|nr:hypothetical protein CAPTEDRAFT_199478 [Capitella teleta]|eukprot:ELU14526.1 hypothetical protein CAPTEDRAFT_199478 [Capitella teleta]